MSRTWNRITGNFGLAAFILLGTFLLAGCGGGKQAATGVSQYYGNYHLPGWITAHAGPAVAGINACTACHELSLIKAGNGLPNCLTTGCHHQSTPNYALATLHGTHAKAAADPVTGGSLGSCQICHGNNFAGGVSASTCFTCHGVNAPHPAKPWRTSAGSVLSHTTVDPSNAGACAQCHFPGSPSNPAGHPAAPAPPGTAPGCYNATLCHGANGAPHPVPFLAGQLDADQNGHVTVTAAAFSGDCATCHAYSGTAPITTAPLCNACHKLADPTIAASGAGTCLSCHVGSQFKLKGPSNPTAPFPNLAGAHVKHMGLATALACNTCHGGSGSGTTLHYSLADARVAPNTGPAPVSLDAVYQAQTGGNAAFSATALTCSNVSCHGGQTTPAWQGGTLPVNGTTYCTACHVVNAAQFNAPTGRHGNPGEHNQTCDYCHDMTQAKPGAQNHFKYLDTQSVSGVSGTPADQYPSDTILFGASVTGARTYAVTGTGNAQGKGGCALTCHTEIHTASSYHWN